MDKDTTIDKIFPEIRDELGYKDSAKDLTWLEDFSEFLETLGSIGFLLKIVFIAIVIAIIIFVLYKIIVSFTKSNKKIQTIKEISKESNDLTFSLIVKKIESLKAKGDYIKALLFMHYGTIKFLKENNILMDDRDYTNREILSLISKKPFLTTFESIAIKAQGILFNDQTVDEKDFYYLEVKFKKDFL